MVNTSMLSQATIDELAFSNEEIEEIKKAREMPVIFEEDCPETTPERARMFRRVNPPRAIEGRLA